jgi:hypothetical protein
MAQHGLYVPVNAPWYPALRAELLAFPAGKTDDQVDMLGLLGQLLDTFIAGTRPTPEEKPLRDAWDRARERHENQPVDWRMV